MLHTAFNRLRLRSVSNDASLGKGLEDQQSESRTVVGGSHGIEPASHGGASRSVKYSQGLEQSVNSAETQIDTASPQLSEHRNKLDKEASLAVNERTDRSEKDKSSIDSAMNFDQSPFSQRWVGPSSLRRSTRNSTRKVSNEERNLMTSNKGDFKPQPRTRPLRRPPTTFSSLLHSKSRFDHIDVCEALATPNVFRYTDLPQELQDLVLRFALEPEENTSFPSYDYLIVDHDSAESDTFFTGHRIWLAPQIKLGQFAVSQKFLRDVIEVFGKLTPIEVLTQWKQLYSSGGAVVNHSPLRRFEISRKRLKDRKFMQNVLTDLLTATSQLKLSYDKYSPTNEILSILSPLMSSLTRVEAHVPQGIVWLRGRHVLSSPHGALSRCATDNLSLCLRDWTPLVALLKEEELGSLKIDQCLPHDLRCVFDHDLELARFSTDAAAFKRSLANGKILLKTSKKEESIIAGSVDVLLSFRVNAFIVEPKPDHDPYTQVTISVKFDGHNYSFVALEISEYEQ